MGKASRKSKGPANCCQAKPAAPCCGSPAPAPAAPVVPTAEAPKAEASGQDPASR